LKKNRTTHDHFQPTLARRRHSDWFESFSVPNQTLLLLCWLTQRTRLHFDNVAVVALDARSSRQQQQQHQQQQWPR